MECKSGGLERGHFVGAIFGEAFGCVTVEVVVVRIRRSGGGGEGESFCRSTY